MDNTIYTYVKITRYYIKDDYSSRVDKVDIKLINEKNYLSIIDTNNNKRRISDPDWYIESGYHYIDFNYFTYNNNQSVPNDTYLKFGPLEKVKTGYISQEYLEEIKSLVRDSKINSLLNG